MKITVDTDQLRLWRKERGWSQEFVAEKAGISLRTIQRIENGGIASHDSAVSLANVYDVKIADFLVDEEQMLKTAIDKQKSKNLIQFKLSFGIHAVVYVMVSIMLILINLADNPSDLWFIWPVVGWGIGVVAHGGAFYLVDYIAKAEREMHELEAA